VKPKGGVIWINGPVMRVRMSEGLQMLEQVEVGEHHLVGEVISLQGDVATVQVYEDTVGLQPGAPVYGVGSPLSVELGPGLMGGIYDGIQRPLELIEERSGIYIGGGISVPALSRERRWQFQPALAVGQVLHGGETLGAVVETALVTLRLPVPSRMQGEVVWVAAPGDYTVLDAVARVRTARGEEAITMMERWPVRQPRPIAERLTPGEPLITGQRVIDALFPIAKGGTAAVPGGFGAGKTVLQQALAKWSDADIIIYVGCGERGNEMADVLREFPNLTDPKTGRPLIERTILIANTSNMPVAAREASIYTGITLAEYYRDAGLSVALMADSTSRWAEALREISGRLEEMPAEEGFPAYLPSRLASFYERAGRVRTLAGDQGSVTIIGAVSPPSGDFSEPVTQHTQRFVRVFWALDKALASARHFPAVNWIDSYSGYTPEVRPWWAEHVSAAWDAHRAKVVEILQGESRLQEIVRLVGPDTLPDAQRYLLFVARLIKDGFLQQNAMDAVDAFTPPAKQGAMLALLAEVYDRGLQVIARGAPVGRLQDEVTVWPQVRRMGAAIANDDLASIAALQAQIIDQLASIEEDYLHERHHSHQS
jgi:V/A-type H+-transporting ATPase subunit A